MLRSRVRALQPAVAHEGEPAGTPRGTPTGLLEDHGAAVERAKHEGVSLNQLLTSLISERLGFASGRASAETKGERRRDVGCSNRCERPSRCGWPWRERGKEREGPTVPIGPFERKEPAHARPAGPIGQIGVVFVDDGSLARQ